VSYFWGWRNNVQYTVVDVDGRVRRTVEVPFGASPMLHDMSLTEASVILYDQPVVFDLEMAMGGSSFPYRWDNDYTPHIGVLPRDGDADDVRWYEVEPCYVFHPMNAYDDGDHIVIDVVRHPKMFDGNHLGPDEGPPTLDRWTIDPTAGKVIEERTDDRPQEFPRVDERLVGRRHRYGYAACGLDDAPGGAGVVKHDFAAGTSSLRLFPNQPGPGEFVFLPAAADAAEDDGVLVGFVHDSETDTSDLLFLDAATLEDVAAIHLPVRVPFGFHGNWVDAPAD
jgi:carotenoid cleavage dioxygenase